MSFLIIIRCQKACTSKKMLSALGIEYEKIDACKDNCMLFYKEHKNEMKCVKCGKLKFIEVINEDSEKVTMKVAHKQLHYMSLTPRMKRLFLSKKIARHIRWHKEGVRENDQVMVHPSDSDAWKALDNFDAGLSSSLVATGESLVLLCCVLIINLILIY
jgi:hypothetical protein